MVGRGRRCRPPAGDRSAGVLDRYIRAARPGGRVVARRYADRSGRCRRYPGLPAHRTAAGRRRHGAAARDAAGGAPAAGPGWRRRVVGGSRRRFGGVRGGQQPAGHGLVSRPGYHRQQPSQFRWRGGHQHQSQAGPTGARHRSVDRRRRPARRDHDPGLHAVGGAQTGAGAGARLHVRRRATETDAGLDVHRFDVGDAADPVGAEQLRPAVGACHRGASPIIDVPAG